MAKIHLEKLVVDHIQKYTHHMLTPFLKFSSLCRKKKLINLISKLLVALSKMKAFSKTKFFLELHVRSFD